MILETTLLENKIQAPSQSGPDIVLSTGSPAACLPSGHFELFTFPWPCPSTDSLVQKIHCANLNSVSATMACPGFLFFVFHFLPRSKNSRFPICMHMTACTSATFFPNLYMSSTDAVVHFSSAAFLMTTYWRRWWWQGSRWIYNELLAPNRIVAVSAASFHYTNTW